MRDFARLSRYGPSTSASVGRCPRTHQQLRTGRGGQTVLRAFGATQVTATTSTSSTGGGGEPEGRQGGARGWPPAAREANTCPSPGSGGGQTPGEGRCVGRRVGAPVLHRGGGAHSALPSRLGPDHHHVKLLKRCKIFLLFTPRTGSGEQSYFLAYSCVFCRNGIAPYRELTLLAHRDNVKRVHGMHRVCGSGELSYFLAYSCVLSRSGIAPYRELTLLAHRDNVKRVHGMHRVYGSRQRSYFLIVRIYTCI